MQVFKYFLPKQTAACWVTNINVVRIIVFKLRSSVLSSGSRLSCRLKFAWTFSRCGMLARDTRRLCGHFESSSSLLMSTFPTGSFLAHSGNSDPGSCLQQRDSSHFRSILQLLATLEYLTLRQFDLNTQQQVSLHFVQWDSNLVDWVLSVSPATGCTRARRCRRACSRTQPGSSSASTLPRSFLLLPVLTSFSPPFSCSGCETNQEDCSNHMWNCPSSLFLVSTYLMWICGPGWFCQITYQAQLCWSEIHVSLLDTSAFDDHLDHRFSVLKNIEHRTSLWRLHVWGNTIDVA